MQFSLSLKTGTEINVGIDQVESTHSQKTLGITTDRKFQRTCFEFMQIGQCKD